MALLSPESAMLVIIDLQERLVPAIADYHPIIANVRRLLSAAALFNVPVLFTEQNPNELGSTVDELKFQGAPVLSKMVFDASRAAGFLKKLGDRRDVIVTGCEAHICVLQTVVSLLSSGRCPFVVEDAVGSRRAESKEVGLRRMARHGAETITAEMVIFEWLGTASDARFREAEALVK